MPKLGKPKARGDGEGTVYKTKSGRHVAAITLPPDADGKRRRRVLYRRTATEARAALAQLQDELRRGILRPSEKLTTADLLDRWLADVVRPARAPSTTRKYERAIRLYLAPQVGATPLVKLGPVHVQRLLADLRGRGLSPAYISLTHTVLRAALAHALRWELVTRNVAALVTGVSVERPELHLVTPELGRRILEAVEPDELGPFYTTVLGLGLRYGEGAGLRWRDVDFAAGRVRVAGQLPSEERWSYRKRKAGGTLDLPLPAFVAQALRVQHDRQAAHRAGNRRWKGWADNDPVFTTTIGTPLHYGHTLKRFHRLLERAGLPRLRLHDLRHGCATILLARGVPLKTIQEILGHRKLATTADLYAHVLPQLVGSAMAELDAALQGPAVPPGGAAAIGVAITAPENGVAMAALPGKDGARMGDG